MANKHVKEKLFHLPYLHSCGVITEQNSSFYLPYSDDWNFFSFLSPMLRLRMTEKKWKDKTIGLHALISFGIT